MSCSMLRDMGMPPRALLSVGRRDGRLRSRREGRRSDQIATPNGAPPAEPWGRENEKNDQGGAGDGHDSSPAGRWRCQAVRKADHRLDPAPVKDEVNGQCE